MAWWQITERKHMISPAGLCNTGHHSDALSNTGYHRPTPINADQRRKERQNFFA
jgi:hypothetical protein